MAGLIYSWLGQLYPELKLFYPTAELSKVCSIRGQICLMRICSISRGQSWDDPAHPRIQWASRGYTTRRAISHLKQGYKKLKAIFKGVWLWHNRHRKEINTSYVSIMWCWHIVFRICSCAYLYHRLWRRGKKVERVERHKFIHFDVAPTPVPHHLAETEVSRYTGTTQQYTISNKWKWSQ
jgi:hypothetical protein